MPFESPDLPLDEARLDPKMTPIVWALNDAGYTTWNSCQGGTGHEVLVGLVEFNEVRPFNREERKEIRAIVRTYTDVPFAFRHFMGFNRILFERPL